MTTDSRSSQVPFDGAKGVRFKLIMLFIDENRTDEAMDASRKAGATGATLISNAQGQGLQQRFGLFGLELLSPRNVVLILVEARRCEAVMDAIAKATGLDESLDTGIALELDVNRALGLSEHIRTLSDKLPVD